MYDFLYNKHKAESVRSPKTLKPNKLLPETSIRAWEADLPSWNIIYHQDTVSEVMLTPTSVAKTSFSNKSAILENYCTDFSSQQLITLKYFLRTRMSTYWPQILSLPIFHLFVPVCSPFSSFSLLFTVKVNPEPQMEAAAALHPSLPLCKLDLNWVQLKCTQLSLATLSFFHFHSHPHPHSLQITQNLPLTPPRLTQDSLHMSAPPHHPAVTSRTTGAVAIFVVASSKTSLSATPLPPIAQPPARTADSLTTLGKLSHSLKLPSAVGAKNLLKT